MALISTLVDNFNDNSINGTLWTSWADGGCTTQETGEQLVVTLADNTVDSNGGLLSNATYDLTASAIYIKVPQTASGSGCSTRLMLYADATNSISIYKRGTNFWYNYTVGGTPTADAITYNAVDQLWWKLRESGGKVYWDYSANGTTWNNLFNVNTPITITALYVKIWIYEYTADTPAGASWIDNVNFPPLSYTSGDEATLPTGTTDLADHTLDSGDLTAILSNDDTTYVGQSASGEYSIFQFKDTITGSSVDLTWSGKSDLAPSTSKVQLQVYKVTATAGWVDAPGGSASNNAANAGDNFDLTSTLSSSTTPTLADCLDGSNVLTTRVYQNYQ